VSSSFEFLAPDAATEHAGELPLARSPIEWTHRERGAGIRERDGWRVVASYGSVEREARACRTTVGVADVSQLGKIELQGPPDAIGELVAGIAGERLTLGEATLADGVWCCPMTAGRVLCVTEPEATARVRGEIEAAAGGDAFVAVNELTCALGSNAVVGPLAREAFARATALDMRPERFGERAFAPVSVARTAGLVLRTEGDHFLHLFGAGYAQYVWTVFVDAAEHLGGCAVGEDALLAARGATVEVADA
jgi:glycine cleavage system aminomethyltransferase T